MVPAVVGKYLERDVVLYCPQDFAAIGRSSLTDATLLVWLGTSLLPESAAETFVTAAIASSPSALVVAGGSAELFWDRLLRALQYTTVPMMTSFEAGDLTEALDAFFHATWPSDDRFDTWTRYVVSCQPSECDVVRQRIETFLESRRE